LARTRETSVSVCTGCSPVTTSVAQSTLVDICVDNNKGDERTYDNMHHLAAGHKQSKNMHGQA